MRKSPFYVANGSEASLSSFPVIPGSTILSTPSHISSDFNSSLPLPDPYSNSTFLFPSAPVFDGTFDFITICFISGLLLLSLLSFVFIFHLRLRSRQYPHLKNFNSLWTVRLLLVFFAILWALNEVVRLQFIRRNYILPLLPPLTLNQQANLCKVHVVLSVGLFEPAFLTTLLFLVNVSIKKHSPSGIWAVIVVWPICLPLLVLQILAVFFSPLQKRLPIYLHSSSFVSTDNLGNQTVLCTYPVYSSILFGGFTVAYLLAFVISCWRVISFVINRKIQVRVNLLATSFMIALPLQILCLVSLPIRRPDDPFHCVSMLVTFLVESGSSSDTSIVASVSIADPYVLLRMTNGSLQLLVGDPSSCSVSLTVPSVFESSKKSISACTLYHDKGPEPWLRKTSTDAWLSSGMGEAIDGADGVIQDQGDVYCVVCYENGSLEIFDVPSFTCVFSVDKFISGRTYLVDTFMQDSVNGLHAHSKNTEDVIRPGQKENSKDVKINVVELMMHRWIGKHSRPFLFGILADGTILSYHAYVFEGSESSSKVEGSVSSQNSISLSSTNASRLRNLRFVRVPVDNYAREEMPSGTQLQRMNVYKNIGGSQGIFLTGSRPSWFMVFRERLRIHPQLCDGPIVAFTVLHNVNCNHGLIYVTALGTLKICQLPSFLSYDNYWPVQKIPLKGTPHQVAYFAEKNVYSVIVSVPVLKPLNQVLSSIADQEVGQQFDPENLNYEGSYPIEEFEVRILEPEKSGGPWKTRASIPMQSSENALTVRMVTLFNTKTKENETLLAVGTAYVQGEDVAARGRVLLFSIDRTADNSRTLVSEVYSKELKGAIPALASLQGHLLIASGPKIILHKWTGSELNGVAFCDYPPLHAVSLNIVKNFILLGDIHKSISFVSWKEPQLSLLAKDFSPLDCLATEFLIDGSTLSLVVSDDQKNVQIFYYAPKVSESWKGQKLLSRAEFHVGSRITKFLRLQLLPTTSERTATTPGSDKTNRFATVFGTLEGSLGCIAPLDELTFRRLQSLQKKLVTAVTHVAGLNPRSFRQFRSNGKAHRPGPDNIVDCELLSHYEMLPLEEQLEIAQQIGTTRMQIMSNLNDMILGTSFL